MGLTVFLTFILGLVPSVIWLIFYLREDARHPEPARTIMYAFFGGVLVTPIVLLLQLFLEGTFSAFGIGSYTVIAITVFAGIEELFKFLGAYFVVGKRKEFNEPLDAMIYMITASVGFAAVENIASITRFMDGVGLSVESVETTILRFVGATLLHTVASGIVGYYWGHAMVHKWPWHRSVLVGLGWAIALHTVFNYFILVSGFVLPTLLLVVSAFVLLADFEFIKKEEGLNP